MDEKKERVFRQDSTEGSSMLFVVNAGTQYGLTGDWVFEFTGKNFVLELVVGAVDARPGVSNRNFTFGADSSGKFYARFPQAIPYGFDRNDLKYALYVLAEGDFNP